MVLVEKDRLRLRLVEIDSLGGAKGHEMGYLMTVEMRYITHMERAVLTFDCTPAAGWPKEADDLGAVEFFNIRLACLATLRLAFLMRTLKLPMTRLTVDGAIDNHPRALYCMTPYGLDTARSFNLENLDLGENLYFGRTEMKMTFDAPCVDAVREMTQILSGKGAENCIILRSLLAAQTTAKAFREQVGVAYSSLLSISACN